MNGKFILHYFPVNGRAATARAILSYAKADWTNDLVKKEDWIKIKSNDLFEFGQMPILEHNGKRYSQSIAINIYLSKIFNLYGKNIEEEYEINSLFCINDDLGQVLVPVIFCQDANKKEELKKVAIEKLNLYLKKLEIRYQNLGNKNYYLGEFSAADIYLTVNLFTFLNALEIQSFENVAPNLWKLINRIKEKELKEFFEKYNL